MAVKQDYYKVLGIDRNADDKTIKKAYRKMAKKYHPDMNPGDAVAEQKFKEITEAYNVLSDSEKKKLYDQFGHAAFEEGFSPGDGDLLKRKLKNYVIIMKGISMKLSIGMMVIF